MKKIDIVVHIVDDYQWLYVNGAMAAREHSDTLEYWLLNVAEFPVQINSCESIYHEGDLIDKYTTIYGSLPDTLEEIENLDPDKVEKEYKEYRYKELY